MVERREKVKKGIIFILMAAFLLFGKTVYAEEYYKNHLGVSFTKEQYDFYTNLMHEGYQEAVTQEMLNEIANEDLDSIEINKVSLCPTPTKSKINPGGQLRDDCLFVSTSAKSLEMANACNGLGHCRMYAFVEWFGEPNQQSYDVFGAYFDDGPSIIGSPIVVVSTEDEFASEEVVKYESDGFGAVVPVLSGEGLMIDMSFAYSGNGGIFISYQHAMSYISLANAQLFNIDFSGYGNVFSFYGAAVGIYDQMPGVHMDV